MNLFAGFHDISFWQLIPVAAVALFASIVGGVSGYGTGALMPLVLVRSLAPSRSLDHRHFCDVHEFEPRFRVPEICRLAAHRDRAGSGSADLCVGARGYTRLSSAGAALVIGSMLILSVPLRRL
jgi:hypothetical protein